MEKRVSGTILLKWWLLLRRECADRGGEVMNELKEGRLKVHFAWSWQI